MLIMNFCVFLNFGVGIWCKPTLLDENLVTVSSDCIRPEKNIDFQIQRSFASLVVYKCLRFC